MRPILVVATLVLLASTARAESEPHKDPTTATMTSIGGTVLPILAGAVIANTETVGASVLIGAGAVLGPSAGHWYAGEVGWRGLAIRGAGIATVVAVWDDAANCYIGDGGEEGRNCKLAHTVFLVGVGVYLSGVVYDWYTAGDSARRRNTRTVQIAPTVVSGTRSTGAGLGLRAAF